MLVASHVPFASPNIPRLTIVKLIKIIRENLTRESIFHWYGSLDWLCFYIRDLLEIKECVLISSFYTFYDRFNFNR